MGIWGNIILNSARTGFNSFFISSIKLINQSVFMMPDASRESQIITWGNIKETYFNNIAGQSKHTRGVFPALRYTMRTDFFFNFVFNIFIYLLFQSSLNLRVTWGSDSSVRTAETLEHLQRSKMTECCWKYVYVLANYDRKRKAEN